MFVDEAKVYIRSGDGGNGIIAFRREKYVPRGGPSGGDGGRGGHVIFQVNAALNTLTYFKYHAHFRAQNGSNGGSANKTGANADDLILEVPRGTIIRDAETGELIADLVRADDRVVLLEGGRGGKGNSRFTTSSNRAPRVAERGAPGKEVWVRLELRLLADVGLVGIPNAGKSTLLSVVSNAKPKIADYPFTTLEPNLGVVTYDDRDLVFADIPGLIEGAHLGVGLGHAFLRHVQRCRILIHVLDGTSTDPLADYNQINTELALYDDNLAKKPQIVVFNKIDLPDAQAMLALLQDQIRERGIDPIPISAATRQNIDTVIQRAFYEVAQLPPVEDVPAEALRTYGLDEEAPIFTLEKTEENVYVVRGQRIERAAAMTYWDYDQAVLRFQKILEILGITAALEAAGVQPGDTVYIGEHELEWSD